MADMELTSWIAIISVLQGLAALILLVYGAARTQRALGQAKERDKLIDVMAWIDRHVFGSGARASRS